MTDEQQNEPDIQPGDAAIIGVYTLGLSVAFFVSVFALFMYFHWEVARMREQVVYQGEDTELATLKAAAASKLEKGGDGVVVPINAAMDAAVREMKSQPSTVGE